MVLRPSVTEVLLGIRRVMADVVLPDITSPYIKERIAAPILDTLEALAHRWDKAIPSLMEENDDLERLLGRAATIFEETAGREHGSLLTDLARQIRGELHEISNTSKYPSYGILAKAHLRLKGLLVQTIEAIGVVEGTQGSDAKWQDLEQQIRSYLKQSIDRELALSVTRR